MSDEEDKDFEPCTEEPTQLLSSSSSDEDDKCACSKDRRQCSVHRQCSYQSKVWEYFDKKKDSLGVCRLCGNRLSCRTSITNLKMHLKRKHPITYAEMTGDLLFDGEGCGGAGGGTGGGGGREGGKLFLLRDDAGKMQEYVVESLEMGRGEMWRWYSFGSWGMRCRLCGVRFPSSSNSDELRSHLRKRHTKQYRKLLIAEEKLNASRDSAKSESSDVLVEDADDEKVASASQDEVTKVDLEESRSCGAADEGAKDDGAKPSIWSYFRKIKMDTALCRFCDKSVPWARSVEALRRHLAQDHPSVAADEQGYQSNEETKRPSTHQVLIEEMYLDEDILNEDDVAKSSAKKRKRSSGKTTGNSDDWAASLDRFGLYIASLMKMLPRATVSRFQVQIIDRLLKERTRRGM